MAQQPEILHTDPGEEWNGDYSWCDGCRAWVHIDFWTDSTDSRGGLQYRHRGHLMDRGGADTGYPVPPATPRR